MPDPGFQYQQWQESFPALSAQVPAGMLAILYRAALQIPLGSQVVNDACLTTQQTIDAMNLLVAHLAVLSTRDAGAVGRIASAGEGSVSTTLDYPARGTTDAWFGQTQPGALFWLITAKYRSAHYVPGLPAICRPGIGIALAPNVWPGNGGFGGGPGFGYGGW